ncbi:MAG: NTP transferase domain-containing protein [Acidimicrobiia bacterium]
MLATLPVEVSHMDKVATLILAAGGSVRLGRPKQLIDWGGRPLLQHVVSRGAVWPASTMTVVIGAHAEEILDRVDFGEASIVINDDWSEGMATSLRVGLDAVSRDNSIEHVIVGLGDQPGVDGEVVDRLVASRHAARAVVPKYRYTWGNPVVIDRWLWPRVMAISGDAGARTLLLTHPEWVHEVWVDGLPPADVDTEDDIVELRPRA